MYLWGANSRERSAVMVAVVTEACSGCKYTDCVTVCPVDAFREGELMLFVDPEVCTGCQACLPECPVEAIYMDDDVPDDQREYVALNAEMAKVYPPITQKKQPLAR
jgi:ferredoxin